MMFDGDVAVFVTGVIFGALICVLSAFTNDKLNKGEKSLEKAKAQQAQLAAEKAQLENEKLKLEIERLKRDK